MTPLSRRTFGTMALTALLTGCGHTGGDRPATAPSAATRGGTTDTAGTTPAAPETTGTPRPWGVRSRSGSGSRPSGSTPRC